MAALTIPNIFFEGWFWFAIAIPIAFIVHFLRKISPAPFPKSGTFFTRHKVTIRKAIDVLLICIIIFSFLYLFPAAMEISKILSHPDPAKAEIQQPDRTIIYICLILWSGQSGLFLGVISIFQKNLTKTKRVILLVACLLPVVFTVLLLLKDKTLGSGLIIRLCFNSSFLNWIFNAPAIFLNKPFLQLFESNVHKFKSMFGHHSH